jgi:Eco29kI-like restriction endonuclease
VPPPNRPKKTKLPGLEPLVDLLPPATNDPHFFNFDLDRGIRLQVVEKLEGSPILPLQKNVGPPLSGIYALYHKNSLVYVGKATKEMTKSARTLRQRLNEHCGKISKRQNITLEEMQVRYLTFESEWWVFAAEFAIVVHYKPEWNFSGFGSKTPGAGRPGTHRVSVWDQKYPPKLP